VIRVAAAVAGAVILMGGVMPPISHRYADVNGVRLHYATTGQGPLIVFLVPTLVIWGEKDTALLTGNLTGLDEYVPQLTVRRIPDATHWVVRERPAEVNRLIRAFLAEH
jgi:pimeloyl-ACP methyl ester carboxylesterase